MRHSFLCHQHRNWLLQHPQMALSIWFNNHEQACQLAEDEHFARATAFAGCALEAAEIAIAAQTVPSPELLEHFGVTSALLTSLLKRGAPATHHACRPRASHVLH
jgi:hypothetical protein